MAKNKCVALEMACEFPGAMDLDRVRIRESGSGAAWRTHDCMRLQAVMRGSDVERRREAGRGLGTLWRSGLRVGFETWKGWARYGAPQLWLLEMLHL